MFLERYFKDPASLNTPLIRVKLSANVSQYGENSFTKQDVHQEMKDELQDHLKEFKTIRTDWGAHPVLAYMMKVDDVYVFSAWAGLNEKQAGWTLLFNLVFPEKRGHPNQEDRDLWNNFITKTEEIDIKEHLLFLGHDMQDGYTNVDGQFKFRIIAEKRICDEMLQVAVFTENSNSTFEYIEISENTLLGKHKEKLMISVRGRMRSMTDEPPLDCNGSVFLKKVTELTPINKNEKGVFVFSKIFPSK